MIQNMTSIYKKQFNLENCRFSLIEHEDAIVAIVYRVTDPNGAQLILKICSRVPDYFREIYYLKKFSGILPVAEIIDVVDPAEDIHGAILMQCFPGALLKSSELTQEQAYELGAVLARLHLNRTEYYGDLIDTDSLSLDPKSYFTHKFEEGLEECANHLPKTLLDQCRDYYNANINHLETVDGPCIIHRDFRPGNIIINNGKLQGIIDWASARAGFAEDDFCPWELGEWTTNFNNKQSFLNGYASIRPVPDYEAVMPFLRLNRAIATIGFTVKRGTWDNSSARLYKVNRDFLDKFFERKFK